jgi:hypothetical protein
MKTSPVILFFKSHVDTFTRKDGTVVQAHERKGGPNAATHYGQRGLFDPPEAQPEKEKPRAVDLPSVWSSMPEKDKLFAIESIDSRHRTLKGNIRASAKKIAASDWGDLADEMREKLTLDVRIHAKKQSGWVPKFVSEQNRSDK